MAHCDPAMSDIVGMDAPSGKVGIVWHDDEAAGSNYGLGCSSNGRVAACSMGGNFLPGPYLKVYDPDGIVVWSADGFDFFTFTSAPLIDEQGAVIAADSHHVVRFDPGGSVRWDAETAGGLPISPVLTRGGALVLATLGGPVSAHDVETGEMLETLDLEAELNGLSGRFSTRNTPAVSGDRVYVLTEFLVRFGEPDLDRTARLYAIDVDLAAPPGDRLRPAWFFEFGARSGATPVYHDGVVFFDGDRIEPGNTPEDPHFFAVRDLGDRPALEWTFPLPAPGFASAARDPRGGLWVFGTEQPFLYRLSEDEGEALQILNVDEMVGEPGPHYPWSAISVARGPGSHPVLVFTATAVSGSHFLVAIDAAEEALLWKVRFGTGLFQWSAAQYPILREEGGEPVVAVTTFANGVFGISATAGG